MTGTSIDGADGVLVAIPDNYTTGILSPIATAHIPFGARLRSKLMSLQQADVNEIEREALTANELADVYAQCVFELLDKVSLLSSSVTAIAVHGQTVRHRPELGYTRQINNPALLAEKTGIDVIADFRSRDLAAGGQGAPLVPAFHHALFGSGKKPCVVLNIGGIANISILDQYDNVIGFDTGPGNVLLDLWISKKRSLLYDEDGKWAASGNVNDDLLNEMLSDPFFSLPPPKSTGRDLFNSVWLENILSLSSFADLAQEDVQATLSAFTAVTIVDAIVRYAPLTSRIFVCGGGAKNYHLISDLTKFIKRFMPDVEVVTTEAIGIDPMHVEALAFAWLAHRFMLRLPGNLPKVTGARGPRILGAFYPGSMSE